jgi:hypothetical protein
MKKLIITLFILLVSHFYIGTAEAVDINICSNCHTMFNSQDADSAIDSCIYCHTTESAVGPRIDSPTMLSAGSFNDAFVTSENNTHNVQDLTGFKASEPDHKLGNKAPGGIELPEQLKCAGTYGCHGNHDDKKTSSEGIHGAHHSGGKGYKFLEIAEDNSGDSIPVDGYASPDYEAGGANESNHNIYVSGPTGISTFCNNCHDDFHGTVTTGSDTKDVWTRHPTDIEVSSLGNLEKIAVDYYNTPFGFTLDGISDMELTTATAYTVKDAKVVCLSCHRAHASQYADILRFDYQAQVAGSGNTTGCLACHARMR